jgi:hypothetical protein
MAKNSVNVPGGAGGMQGVRTGHAAEGVYDVLDTAGDSVKTGDISRTRITGGLGHATLHSKTPPSGHEFYFKRHGGKD